MNELSTGLFTESVDNAVLRPIKMSKML